jgi:hypothetical protein
MRPLCLTSILGLAIALLPSTARADDRATALQDFQEGRDLMAAGKTAEACPKFAAAAQLSQTAGVRLNLAECYAKLGKTASAWAKANEALVLADRANDSAAAEVARTQMSDLEPKLCYLTILVATEAAPPGLEVALDGESVPDHLWGTRMPADPGDHELTAKAPGRVAWATKATVTSVPTTVRVPALTIGGAAVPALGPDGMLLADAPPKSDGGEPRAPTSGVPWSRSTAHLAALVSGGLGVVALGIGTGFGIEAASKKSDYEQHETRGVCNDATCAAETQQAFAAATGSTVGFVAGGVLVAAGVVLWLTAPGKGVAVTPVGGPQGLGASVVGSF